MSQWPDNDDPSEEYIAKLKAENAAYRDDMSAMDEAVHLLGIEDSHVTLPEAIRELQARAERAEAACARLREMVERHAIDYSMPPPMCMECGCNIAEHREDCQVALALSDTCGKRYRDIVEAAEALFAGNFIEAGWNEQGQWIDELYARIRVIYEALAATEPSDDV